MRRNAKAWGAVFSNAMRTPASAVSNIQRALIPIAQPGEEPSLTAEGIVSLLCHAFDAVLADAYE